MAQRLEDRRQGGRVGQASRKEPGGERAIHAQEASEPAHHARGPREKNRHEERVPQALAAKRCEERRAVGKAHRVDEEDQPELVDQLGQPQVRMQRSGGEAGEEDARPRRG